MSEPVTRVTVLEQSLADQIVANVEARRITMRPLVAGGPHRHNGPVFGVIETGSVVFQVGGGTEAVLRPGDVFFEPADALIDRFDATADGVTFIGWFLTGPGETPQFTAEHRGSR